MKNINLFLILAVVVIGISSCTYDNVEDLYPQTPECDTLNVTYSQTIAPIMSTNCNFCHSGSTPPANVITDTYEDLKIIVDDGRFWGAVNHESGYSPMPQDRPKLNDCDLEKIRIWLDSGALND